MHPVYRLLESLEVGSYRDYVLIKSADLELMILKVSRDILLIRLRIDEFLELCHIEIVPDADHSLIPANELVFEFEPELIDTLLNLSLDLLFVEAHIWQQILNLFLANFVRDERLDIWFVQLLVKQV